MTEQERNAFLESAKGNTTIFDAIEKSLIVAESKEAKNVMISVSGGADSDLIVHMMHRIRKDMHYVWFNTGMEYEATKKHLRYLEEKYGISIERPKTEVPVPLAVRRCGYPFLSKMVSDYISRLQRHSFDWSGRPFEELLEEYPKCTSALRWWCNEFGKDSRFGISRWKYLKEFMIENPPNFPISAGCCKKAKKDTAHAYQAENGVNLIVTGERKYEGGARGGKSSCFTGSYEKGTAMFRPIFWFKNADKKEYEQLFGIEHSECYTKYGLTRTGCVGCPFGMNWKSELEAAKKYELKLYKMCRNVFKPSYEYTEQYWKFRTEKESSKQGYKQLSLFD